MKITTILHKQNLYRMMRNQWKYARKRRITNSLNKYILEKQNLDVTDANEFVMEEKPLFDFSSVVGLIPQEVPRDKNHPLCKEQPCFIYKDSSVLLEGLQQALVLTNTVELQPETLPIQIMNLIDKVKLSNQDDLVKRCIKSSCLYDAEQKKLPHRKDPSRPAWNFPRDYGITESRKNRMLCSRLLHLCSLAYPEVCSERAILLNTPLSVPMNFEEDILQFQLRSDVFITSTKPLSTMSSPLDVTGHPLPELSVSHPLVSIQHDNFYELKNIYPLKEDSKLNKVHTIMVHYNSTEVKNLFDLPVTETQILGRSLLKAFTAAIAQARYSYGVDVKELPEPITVQCVQTDGRSFHFSVLQLNSADVSSNIRNVFWSLPSIHLYENCSYVAGAPVLEGYNPLVFKHLLAFFVNN